MYLATSRTAYGIRVGGSDFFDKHARRYALTPESRVNFYPFETRRVKKSNSASLASEGQSKCMKHVSRDFPRAAYGIRVGGPDFLNRRARR